MRKEVKYGLWMLGGIWIAAMAALSPQFVVAHRETKDVLHAFDQYSLALVNERFDEAYAYCGTDFRNALPFNQFIGVQKSLEALLGHLRSARRISYDVHGTGTPLSWSATVNADMLYEKKALRFKFVFRKEAGQWVMYGYEQF